MAKTYTSLFENVSTSNTEALTTAESLTPTTGRDYFVWWSWHRGGSLATLTPSLTHAGGLTFTLVGTILSQNGGNASGTMLALFRARATGGESAGTLTGTCNLGSNTNMQGHQYHALEVTNCDPTTPIPQISTTAAENNTTDGNITVTVPGSFVAASSGVISCCVGSNTSTIATVPTGWTQLGAGVSQTGSPLTSMTVAYLDSNDSDADWSGFGTGATEDLAALIAEVAEAAAAAGSPWHYNAQQLALTGR